MYSVNVSTWHQKLSNTQPTNQTARFWSRASLQVSCTGFLHKLPERVSPLLGLLFIDRLKKILRCLLSDILSPVGLLFVGSLFGRTR